MKLKILIADDELWIRKWLVNIIADLRDDVIIVKAVDNGKEALDIIRSEHIDILISDIHMPLMTGLELAEEAKDTKVILISGYDEFEYARKAIRLQVMGYLLKPIVKKELEEVLDDTISSIYDEKNNNVNIETVHNAISNLFMSIIKNKEMNNVHKLSEFAAELKTKSMIVGEIQLDITEKNYADFRACFMEQIRKRYKTENFYLIQESTLRYIVVVLATFDETDKIFMLKQQITDCVKRKFVNSLIILSAAYSDVKDLVKALDEIEFLRKGITSEHQKNKMFNSETMYAVRSSMSLATKSGDFETFSHYINHIKFRLEDKDYNPEEFRMFVFGVVSDVIKNIEETNGESRNSFISEGYEFCVKIQNYNNMKSMLQWVEEYVQRVIEYLKTNQYNNVRDIVEGVRKSLLIHYAEDISLSGICDQFGINRSYFSKKFKDESGMNFSDMLTNIRLDVASNLISNTKLSLVDISEKVGFNDPKYFSKVFRKHYDMTPSQYREKLGGVYEK